MTAESTSPSALGGEGPLARMLEGRGGTAAAEAPFVIEHREALVYMLCEAAELEHAIMCQYLFAAFSLKESADEGLSETELAAVIRWRRQISHVATQEMLHLTLVHNVLSAIGSAPHLGRPNLPQPANHYPAGVQLLLLPFGEVALRHFMFLERPEGMALDDAEGLSAVGRSEPAMPEADIVPRLQDFATVGHLYRSIEEGLAHLTETFGERGLFVGPPNAQATQAHFSWPELVAVTDLASAQQAIDEILEQGEGPRGAWQKAHFGQFVAILDEYQALKEANPDFDPVRPVMVANVRPSERDDGVALITDPSTARCTDLFNVAYEILLQTFERYFAHTEETEAQLATLADLALSLMFEVLKPLGSMITTLPAGVEFPGQTAGPSFELFYESDYLMPHRGAAWEILEERLREGAEFCERIRTHRADPSLAERLAPIGPALVAMAESLAAHYPEWGGHSRWAPPSGPGAPAGSGSEIEALLARAEELVGPAAQTGNGERASSDMGRLLADAFALTRSAASEGAGTALVGRLVYSVVRPLAQNLTPGGHHQGGAHSSKRADPPTVESPTETVADGLWRLAEFATRLRSAPNPAAELVEATAALQDLACQIAPAEGPGDRTTRLAELTALQAGLDTGVDVAVDGPYLVTNADNLHNWLGEDVPTRPQMALCRCGASAIKPLCDGSHATSGFTDAKDPNRVPDRRDTYVGQQVTIFDNRGICQHSGLCTDRLATVFRTSTEPFVAPSGGRMDEIIRAVRDCPSGALSFALDGREARDDVDQHRDAAIVVTRDGPYRITGGIPVRGADGRAEPRAGGASQEHYALCRCGHSQNKPFCSGMHWYVNFADPLPDPDREPSLFEWAGGLPGLTRATRLFYEKYVPTDPLLAPLFANMSPDHPERVAAWLAEVFRGPEFYTQHYAIKGEGGGYHRMISQHLGKCLTEDQRARWVQLLLRSANEACLPADPEFRSAFTSYLEWGSRLAVENSQTTSEPPQNMPMPRWDWGTAGPPGTRVSALDPQTDEEPEPVALPGPGEAVSFALHIKTLFRSRDRQSMKFAFDLWSYDDVKTHADAILDQVRQGTMPCDGAWSPEQVQVFEQWSQSGLEA